MFLNFIFSYFNSNCRFYAADWCMTRRTRNESIAKCVRDDDCDSCWPCETACFIEGQHLNFEALFANGTFEFNVDDLPHPEEKAEVKTVNVEGTTVDSMKEEGTTVSPSKEEKSP